MQGSKRSRRRWNNIAWHCYKIDKFWRRYSNKKIRNSSIYDDIPSGSYYRKCINWYDLEWW